MRRHDVQVVAVWIDDGWMVVQMARVVPHARGMMMPMAVSMPTAAPVAAVPMAAASVAVAVPAAHMNPDAVIADMNAEPAAADHAARFLAGGQSLLGQVQGLAARHGIFSIRGERKLVALLAWLTHLSGQLAERVAHTGNIRA
jgi:hypothetical protein